LRTFGNEKSSERIIIYIIESCLTCRDLHIYLHKFLGKKIQSIKLVLYILLIMIKNLNNTDIIVYLRENFEIKRMSKKYMYIIVSEKYYYVHEYITVHKTSFYFTFL
jgi:hypothetical protein